MPSELAALSGTAITQFFETTRALVDRALEELLPASDVSPQRTHQAMRWSVFAGGKRFRPILVIATGTTFGTQVERLVRTACAFEMIHTYSLIHDDLPSMDDDNLRRGRPTAHVRFDEATAILAGDALLTFAFQTIAQDGQLDASIRVRLISELSEAAGTPKGMVAGQAEDIEAEARTIDAAELEGIHRRKTGALIVAAARCGAIVAGADESQLQFISEYAAQLGLLFQITDDLLDVTATKEDLGKTPGKDARSLKATYPGLHGLQNSRTAALRAHQSACDALAHVVHPTETLRKIADFILNRTA